MPAIIGPAQTINTRQKMTVHVALFGPDGVTPDTTTTLIVASGSPSIASVALDPSNNRSLVVTGIAAGSALIHANCSPAIPNPLQVQFTVDAAPDLSKIEFVGADAPVAK